MTSDRIVEVAARLPAARRVVVVPGYGLAVAQGQHALRRLVDALIERGPEVAYAIHPVAGRLPGHLNVLLDEAGVPHEQLIAPEQLDDRCRQADLVVVVGADDVVNPVALTDPTSPLHGLAVLPIGDAVEVLVITRGGPGYAGVGNPLFDRPQVTMLEGDAGELLDRLTRAVEIGRC